MKKGVADVAILGGSRLLFVIVLCVLFMVLAPLLWKVLIFQLVILMWRHPVYTLIAIALIAMLVTRLVKRFLQGRNIQ